jgi:hypothetical protein
MRRFGVRKVPPSRPWLPNSGRSPTPSLQILSCPPRRSVTLEWRSPRFVRPAFGTSGCESREQVSILRGSSMPSTLSRYCISKATGTSRRLGVSQSSALGGRPRKGCVAPRNSPATSYRIISPSSRDSLRASTPSPIRRPSNRGPHRGGAGNAHHFLVPSRGNRRNHASGSLLPRRARPVLLLRGILR